VWGQRGQRVHGGDRSKDMQRNKCWKTGMCRAHSENILGPYLKVTEGIKIRK
jgi:hypothetical protein